MRRDVAVFFHAVVPVEKRGVVGSEHAVDVGLRPDVERTFDALGAVGSRLAVGVLGGEEPAGSRVGEVALHVGEDVARRVGKLFVTRDLVGYLDAATKAAGFLQASLYDAKTGQLTRSYRQGASATAGFADDYAFLIRGLFDLYEADFQPDHLRWAETLQKTQDALFWDAKGGGYFNTAGTDPNLLLRSKTDDDGAEPSASSVAALNLARLGQALENEGYTKRAASVLQAFDATLQRAPLALPEMLVALDFQVGPTRQIVVVRDAGRPRHCRDAQSGA